MDTGLGKNWIQTLWSRNWRWLRGQPITLQLTVPGKLYYSFSCYVNYVFFPRHLGVPFVIWCLRGISEWLTDLPEENYPFYFRLWVFLLSIFGLFWYHRFWASVIMIMNLSLISIFGKFQAALEAPRVLNMNSNKYFSGPYGMGLYPFQQSKAFEN